MGYVTTHGESPDILIDDDGNQLTTDAPAAATEDVSTGTIILSDRVVDSGLAVLDTEANAIYLCSSEPATYSDAVTTLALGHKTFSSGGAFGSPSTETDPVGRSVQSTAISDGTITGSGTVTHWAAVDTGNSRLLAYGPGNSSLPVTSGGTFTIPSFKITRPSAVE